MTHSALRSVLILGGGYVGSALVQALRPSAGRVSITTTTPARLPALAAIADAAQILHSSDVPALQAALHGHSHLVVTVGAQRGISYADTYLKTAQNLRAALTDNSSIEQILYTSSYSVYGDRQGDWVTEDSPVRPSNDNGKILAETEQQLLALATPQRPVCILRLGGIYGPGRELERIFAPAAGKTRPGDGTDASNWVHLDDIVGAMHFALTHRLSGIYNLVNSEPVASKALLDWVCDRHNLAPIIWDPSQTSARSYNARVSNQKLRDAGYHFRHPRIYENQTDSQL